MNSEKIHVSLVYGGVDFEVSRITRLSEGAKSGGTWRDKMHGRTLAGMENRWVAVLVDENDLRTGGDF